MSDYLAEFLFIAGISIVSWDVGGLIWLGITLTFLGMMAADHEVEQ